MKFGAIDIGSNAIRFQVSTAWEDQGEIKLKKLEFVRFPLRLGQDVFTTGRISMEKEVDLIKLFEAFKILLDLFEVDHYLICATSAMREAENGKEIASRISKKLDLEVKIISGDEEAWLTNRVVSQYLENHDIVHIDVGGGSTELNIFRARQKIASNSFRIGSVRNLEGKDDPEVWEKMMTWVKKYKSKLEDPYALGTGGNINKISDLIEGGKNTSISRRKFNKLLGSIESMSMEERIQKLMMNPDRADVIVPASKIYLSIMNWSGAERILIPKVGLKDGMILTLIDRYYRHTPVSKQFGMF